MLLILKKRKREEEEEVKEEEGVEEEGVEEKEEEVFKYLMYTSKQCIYKTYYHSKSEDHMGIGFITCNLSYPLKSWELEEDGKKEILRVHR